MLNCQYFKPWKKRLNLWIAIVLMSAMNLFSYSMGRRSFHSPKSTLINTPKNNDDRMKYIHGSYLYDLNHCVHHRILYVTSLLETAQFLLHTNKSLVRYGDGELMLMSGKNICVQVYNKTLSTRLHDILFNTIPNVMIGIPNIFDGFPPARTITTRYWNKTEYIEWFSRTLDYQKQYFDAHISSPYVTTYGTHCAMIEQIYSTLRQVWKDKDIVLLRGNNGQTYTYDVYDTARTQRVLYASKTQAWSHYNEYKSLLLGEDPTKLFILAAGPTSKVLVLDLVLAGRRALDLGHLAKDYNAFMTKQSVAGFYKDFDKC